MLNYSLVYCGNEFSGHHNVFLICIYSQTLIVDYLYSVGFGYEQCQMIVVDKIAKFYLCNRVITSDRLYAITYCGFTF